MASTIEQTVTDALDKAKAAESVLRDVVTRAPELRVSACSPTAAEIEFFRSLNWDTKLRHLPGSGRSRSLYAQLSRMCSVVNQELRAGTTEARQQLNVDYDEAVQALEKKGPQIEAKIAKLEKELSELHRVASMFARRKEEVGQALTALETLLPEYIDNEILAKSSELRNGELGKQLEELAAEQDAAIRDIDRLKRGIEARNNDRRPDFVPDPEQDRIDAAELKDDEQHLVAIRKRREEVQAQINAQLEEINKLRSFYHR